jgi:hypothetical protein
MGNICLNKKINVLWLDKNQQIIVEIPVSIYI